MARHAASPFIACALSVALPVIHRCGVCTSEPLVGSPVPPNPNRVLTTSGPLGPCMVAKRPCGAPGKRGVWFWVSRRNWLYVPLPGMYPGATFGLSRCGRSLGLMSMASCPKPGTPLPYSMPAVPAPIEPQPSLRPGEAAFHVEGATVEPKGTPGMVCPGRTVCPGMVVG